MTLKRPNRYAVTYWLFRDSPKDMTALEWAWNAEDAAFQVSIQPLQFVKDNPSFTFRLIKVEPSEQ